MDGVRRFSSSFFEWLYPSRCALCSVLGDQVICESCLQEFEPADAVHRSIEAGPLNLSANLFSYTGRPGQAVRRLKYSRATALASPMAAMMRAGAERLGLMDFDLVVPIPIHWSRRCVRGFNQSELLCEQMPNVRTDVLRRIRRTKPQARLSREARNRNLEGAFRASPETSGTAVLLIDDVVTSGHTARECARALIDAGARRVAVLAFAGEAH